LYELKQGASIHILARDVRGAAEDKGIGRSKRGVVVMFKDGIRWREIW